MSPKVRKALQIEVFEPDEDILETTCKWGLWRRRLEVHMKYFDIVKPEDMKAALLVHGGNKILWKAHFGQKGIKFQKAIESQKYYQELREN